MVKIALKSKNITPFGGIFYVMDQFSRLGLDRVIDSCLGLRSRFSGYQYSEIISSIFWIYFCGGDCIEDIGTHLGDQLEQRPDTRIPSPDTLLRGIKELAVNDTEYVSEQGVSYAFNTAEKLNELLLSLLLSTGQLNPGEYDLDFDHEFIPTEKYDTKFSYKKERGYFPGVATIGDKIVGIENRDGNTNVRFHQKDTLRNIFHRLATHGVYINRCRMDCGSFSQEIISTVHGYCRYFYIRASRCQSLYERMNEITHWTPVEINFETYEVASIPFTSFFEELDYRLVIQRQKRRSSEQADLFEGEYTYRCIVTNDHHSTEEEVILFYNARGASEQTFDRMNNDFGWKHLPCSFLKENTVFLLLTAMASNFFSYIVTKVSKVFEQITNTNRTKRFLFRFILVPACWIKTARQWVLNIYSAKRYDLLGDS